MQRLATVNSSSSIGVFLGVIFLSTLYGCSSSPYRWVPEVADLQPGRLPIIQGATSSSETQIGILLAKAARYRFHLYEERDDQAPEKKIEPKVDRNIGSSGSDWVVKSLRFEGLSPEKLYRLEARNKKNAVIDKRWFRTIDPKKPVAKFVMGSCIDDAFIDTQEGVWRDILSLKPDFLLLIGDNLYADSEQKHVTPEILWRRHVENRQALHLFRTRELIPVFSTWDDHDYGLDDGDRRFIHKEESRRIFRAFFPQERMKGFLTTGPGVSSHFVFANQSFFLMDNRSFRSPPEGSHPSKKGTHWGAKQEKWLSSGLKQNPRPAWILNGNHFFGAYHRWESFESDHPKNLKKVLSRLKRHPYSVVFGSGDRHWMEIQKIPSKFIGYPTYEFNTSAIHAKLFPSPWKRYPNRRQVFGRADSFNYFWIESKTQGKNIAIRSIGYGPEKAELVDQTFEIIRRPDRLN